MADLLIKNIDEKVLEKLEARARRNNHRLEDEIKVILRRAAEQFVEAELARKIKNSLRGREHSDSAELLREDRAR